MAARPPYTDQLRIGMVINTNTGPTNNPRKENRSFFNLGKIAATNKSKTQFIHRDQLPIVVAADKRG